MEEDDRFPIAAGFDFANMYAKSAIMPVKKGDVNLQQSVDGRVNVHDINAQEYNVNPMNAIGYVGKGLTTGLSMGGPHGALIGGALGLGAAGIDLGRQIHQWQKFKREQERLMIQGQRQNQLLDYREQAMNPMSKIQMYNDFYG